MTGSSVNWPQVLDALRADRKMVVAETLTETRVSGIEGDVLVLEPQNEHASATIERYRGVIEAAASKVLGGSVRVRMANEASNRPPEPGPVKAERLTVSGARVERAKAMRGKDPALDSAMDAMDLELLE